MSTILAALAAFFAGSIGALVKRALVAIGIGIITYSGLDVAFAAARDLVISNYGQISGASAQLIALAGVGQCLGIILGALAARIGLVAVSTIGKVL